MTWLTIFNKVIILPVILLSMLLTGCDRLPFFKKSPEERKDTVAMVEKESILSNDLWWYLDSRSSGGMPIVDESGIEARLKEMVTAKLLAQEARKQQLVDDPSVKYAIDQMLGLRLLDQQVVQPTMTREISDQEIEDYFKSHEAEYLRPAQIRLADIFIALAADDFPGQRLEKKNKAKKVLAEAIKNQGERFGFSKLVKEYSDPHPSYPIGDTGYFDFQGKPLDLDLDLVNPAFTLEEKGKIHDQLVETSEGFHVIMLVGRREAMKTDLEKVRPQIEQRIRREEIKTKREQLIKSLADGSSVKVIENELEIVTENYLKENSSKQETNKAGGFQLPGNN